MKAQSTALTIDRDFQKARQLIDDLGFNLKDPEVAYHYEEIQKKTSVAPPRTFPAPCAIAIKSRRATQQIDGTAIAQVGNRITVQYQLNGWNREDNFLESVVSFPLEPASVGDRIQAEFFPLEQYEKEEDLRVGDRVSFYSYLYGAERLCTGKILGINELNKTAFISYECVLGDIKQFPEGYRHLYPPKGIDRGEVWIACSEVSTVEEYHIDKIVPEAVTRTGNQNWRNSKLSYNVGNQVVFEQYIYGDYRTCEGVILELNPELQTCLAEYACKLPPKSRIEPGYQQIYPEGGVAHGQVWLKQRLLERSCAVPQPASNVLGGKPVPQSEKADDVLGGDEEEYIDPPTQLIFDNFPAKTWIEVAKCSKRLFRQAWLKSTEAIFPSRKTPGKLVKTYYLGKEGSVRHKAAIAARDRRNRQRRLNKHED